MMDRDSLEKQLEKWEKIYGEKVASHNKARNELAEEGGGFIDQSFITKEKEAELEMLHALNEMNKVLAEIGNSKKRQPFTE